MPGLIMEKIRYTISDLKQIVIRCFNLQELTRQVVTVQVGLGLRPLQGQQTLPPLKNPVVNLLL